jgi:opacity protein-like surface antigen
LHAGSPDRSGFGVHMEDLMKSKYLAAALAATCLTSTMAYAQDAQPTGLYVGANAGIAKVDDVDVTVFTESGAFGGIGAEDTLEGEADLKDAVTFGGVVGYDFGMLRADVEVSYARNKVRSLTLEGVNGQPVTLTPVDRADLCDFLDATCGGSGNTFTVDGVRARQLNALANLWVDLPLGPVTPYVGGGIGVGGFEVEGEGEAKFAWQLGAGAALQLTPALALTADYRHRRIDNSRIEADEATGVRFGKLKTNAFTAGLRFYFGGSPVEAAPEYVPAPPPPAPVYTPTPEPTYTPPPPPPVTDARTGERG